MVGCVVTCALSVFCAYVYFDGALRHVAAPSPYPPLEIFMSGVIAGLVVLWPLCLFGPFPALIGSLWAGFVGMVASAHINTLKRIHMQSQSSLT